MAGRTVLPSSFEKAPSLLLVVVSGDLEVSDRGRLSWEKQAKNVSDYTRCMGCSALLPSSSD